MASSKMYCTAMMGASALLFSGADAHGWLGLPAVTFPDGVDKTQFAATIESSASGFSGSFSGSPAANTEAFWTAFNSSKYSSIKDFVTEKGQIVANGANIECGLTDPNETAQPLPDELEWTHSDTEGFTSTHEGPCEAWCDGTRVFQDTDCAAHFTTAPAKMPYDKAACAGASRLTFYWLALHSSTWQVYVDCAALEGGSGSYSPSQSNSTSSGQSSGSTGQSNTPTITTAPPTATTAAPTATTATPTATTATPTTTTATPTVTTSAPSTGSSEEDCGSLDIAGSDEKDEDCGSLDVAGSDEKEEDCGSLDVAGSDAGEGTTVSESSLNFDNVGGSYQSGKVQAQEQN